MLRVQELVALQRQPRVLFDVRLLADSLLLFLPLLLLPTDLWVCGALCGMPCNAPSTCCSSVPSRIQALNKQRGAVHALYLSPRASEGMHGL